MFTTKVAIMVVLIGTLINFDLSEAALSTHNVAKVQRLRYEQALTSEHQSCKCMNWRSCHGEIDSSVSCHPNYIFVCCIIPKPEISNDDEELIQVIQLQK